MTGPALYGRPAADCGSPVACLAAQTCAGTCSLVTSPHHGSYTTLVGGQPRRPAAPPPVLVPAVVVIEDDTGIVGQDDDPDPAG